MPCATSSIPYTGGVQEADRSLWGCSMATSSITGAQGAQEQVTVGASLFQFRSRGLGKAGNNISFSGARGLGKREIPFPFPVHVAQGTGKYHFRFRCTWNLGGWRKPGYRDSSQGLSLSRDLTGAYIFAVFNCLKLSPTLNVWSHVVAMHTLSRLGTYTLPAPNLRSALGSI